MLDMFKLVILLENIQGRVLMEFLVRSTECSISYITLHVETRILDIFPLVSWNFLAEIFIVDKGIWMHNFNKIKIGLNPPVILKTCIFILLLLSIPLLCCGFVRPRMMLLAS